MTKHTILFLAANPSGTDRRALDREAHSIRAELKRSGYRDRFEFQSWWAAEPLDLLRALRELKPTVVHFSGHGSPDGLLFQTAEGRTQVVSPAAIAETFGVAGASVKVVVLSACYSRASAEALLPHVDCVVGMGGSIHDDAARSFAIGFYGALGENESVEAAWRHGCAAINLTGLSDIERPQFNVRTGVDAAQLVPAAAPRQELIELRCPYPGMRPYSADDAAHFHGRSTEIEELLYRLRKGEREIYVVGPAGSGKSSLVAAGLLPRLARGEPRLGSFVVRVMRPREHPTLHLRQALEASDGEPGTLGNAIAASLAHRAAGTSMLIVIDQLEELFTQATSEQRAAFLTSLQHLRAEPRCMIIFTLRADFFSDFMKSPLWTGCRGQLSRVEVGPLRGDALWEAIVRPAHDLGVTVEPELVERLLADAASEPGILPLLQETLVQLWERRRDQRLSLADYIDLGDATRSGLAVALSRTADDTLRKLDPARVPLARRILLRLISFGEGRADTRRQQPRSKLRAADDDPVEFDKVLKHLIDDRLLTTDDADDGGEPRVDLAHEVMITAWQTLASWLKTRRQNEQQRRRLEVAAAQWVEHGRGAGGLLDAVMLAEVDAWRQTEAARELGESADVAEWVAASRAALAKKVETRRRQARWFAGTAGVGLILLLAVIAATAIWVARTQERTPARCAGNECLRGARPRGRRRLPAARRGRRNGGDRRRSGRHTGASHLRRCGARAMAHDHSVRHRRPVRPIRDCTRPGVPREESQSQPGQGLLVAGLLPRRAPVGRGRSPSRLHLARGAIRDRKHLGIRHCGAGLRRGHVGRRVVDHGRHRRRPGPAAPGSRQ